VRRDRVEEEGRTRAEAKAPPEAARPAGVADVITDLQRRAGNRAVSRLLSRQTDGFGRVDLGTAVADEPDILERFGLELAQADAPGAVAPGSADPEGFRVDFGDPDGVRVDLGAAAPAPAPTADIRFRSVSMGGAAAPAVAAPVPTPPPRPAAATPARPPRRPAMPPPAAAPGPRRPRSAAPGGLAGPQTRAVADTRAYAAIRRALGDYEHERKAAAPGTEDRQVQLLARLDELCTAWLTGHRVALGPQDANRWTVVSELAQRVAEERVKLSQAQAHEVYVDSLAAGEVDPIDQIFFGGQARSTPATYEHKFQAASPGARRQGVEARSGFRSKFKRLAPNQVADSSTTKRLELVKRKGLTDAEHAALLVFTEQSGDYNYINPAQVTQPSYDPVTGAKKKSWMASNRERARKGAEVDDWKGVDEATVREEGALHAALAVSAMKKLDPFEGVSYRGETTDAMTVTPGSPKDFATLASTTKNPAKTTSFVEMNLTADRNIAVFWLFDHRGGHLQGRDIQMLSALESEAEVLLFPGSRFEVTEVARGRPAGGEVQMETGAMPDAFAAFKQMTPTILKAKAIYFITAKMLPARPAGKAPAGRPRR
jgi:hypothetical protein